MSLNNKYPDLASYLQKRAAGKINAPGSIAPPNIAGLSSNVGGPGGTGAIPPPAPAVPPLMAAGTGGAGAAASMGNAPVARPVPSAPPPTRSSAPAATPPPAATAPKGRTSLAHEKRAITSVDDYVTALKTPPSRSKKNTLASSWDDHPITWGSPVSSEAKGDESNLAPFSGAASGASPKIAGLLGAGAKLVGKGVKAIGSRMFKGPAAGAAAKAVPKGVMGKAKHMFRKRPVTALGGGSTIALAPSTFADETKTLTSKFDPTELKALRR